ncbi:Hypothetical predicted protein [Pelobates cultripes]|uniref:Uncharacterized protein n=1 Tax=Pelobates cultripes TaxID=61616 RepID=A0AAD1SHF0_PELCU|nr:Hypothetical predicted protein [Pelobates cultripes]
MDSFLSTLVDLAGLVGRTSSHPADSTVAPSSPGTSHTGNHEETYPLSQLRADFHAINAAMFSMADATALETSITTTIRTELAGIRRDVAEIDERVSSPEASATRSDRLHEMA